MHFYDIPDALFCAICPCQLMMNNNQKLENRRVDPVTLSRHESVSDLKITCQVGCFVFKRSSECSDFVLGWSHFCPPVPTRLPFSLPQTAFRAIPFYRQRPSDGAQMQWIGKKD